MREKAAVAIVGAKLDRNDKVKIKIAENEDFEKINFFDKHIAEAELKNSIAHAM